MRYKSREQKIASTQEYQEQRQERLGIAASEFRMDARGVSRQQVLSVGRKRCQDTIQRAFGADDPVLIEALMGLGKSCGVIKIAHRLNEPVSIFCNRGHKGQYNQFQKWCDDLDLNWYLLPSFHHDCETARGDHGEQPQCRVESWYEAGATPSDIHRYGDPPCTDSGRCEYERRLDFDPVEYDVLLGHYSHAHAPKYTTGRVVIFDEFPGEAFLTEFTDPQPLVFDYLAQTNLPFNTFSGLIQNTDTLGWITKENFKQNHDTLRISSADVINQSSNMCHACVPVLTRLLLEMTALGNNWRYAKVNQWRAVHNRRNDHLYLLQLPPLRYATQVIGLDGTPSLTQWKTVLDLGGKHNPLTHQRVLTTDERRRYLRDVLGLNIIQTTPHINPYSSGKYLQLERDRALLQAIEKRHGQRPLLFTSSKAEKKYRGSGVEQHVNSIVHFGDIKGRNDYASARLSAIIGSPNRGDDYVKKWAALAGEPTARQGKGKQLTFSNGGNEFLKQMREHEVLQALMRVGRDGKGAVVYIHTSALPNWVPTAHGPGNCEVQRWTDTKINIIRAIENVGSGTTTDVLNNPGVSCSRQYVGKVLHELAEKGYVSKRDTGSRYEWTDECLSEVTTPVDVRFTHPCQHVTS